MSVMTKIALGAMERGFLTDGWIRRGIRRLNERRLRGEDPGDPAAVEQALDTFAEEMRGGPVAPVPEKANEQHYELPPGFFEKVLGPRLKYSSCYWPEGVETLEAAEEAALAATCERAGIADGMDVLELGCGWGSLTLYLAERFPASRITAVSNSAGQRRFIEARAKAKGLTNLAVVTADMNDFDTEGRFDRVVTVEMFEHMRNWEELLRRISGWLEPDGRLFVHVFCHRDFAYRFETAGPADWMGRHFFTGGIMPGSRLIDRFDGDLRVEERWLWDGTHYARSAEAWLEALDERRDEVLPVLAKVYGKEHADRWFRRWRVFFLACAELFGCRDGEEWQVAHYLMGRG
ncbi:MAG: SAM-dependent methyltransferase [Planctomycetota bacterium]|jgi:cyclopropane-fatty-acyl-phospholipid synthase